MKPLVTQKTINLYQKYIGQLYSDLKKTTPIRVVGSSSESRCGNCVYDIRGRRSSGKYNSSGPSPFEGICPVCGGKGVVTVDGSVDIYIPYRWLDPSKNEADAILVSKLGDVKLRYLEAKGVLTVSPDIFAKLSAAVRFEVEGLKMVLASPQTKRGLKNDYVFRMILKTEG